MAEISLVLLGFVIELKVSSILPNLFIIYIVKAPIIAYSTKFLILITLSKSWFFLDKYFFPRKYNISIDMKVTNKLMNVFFKPKLLIPKKIL